MRRLILTLILALFASMVFSIGYIATVVFENITNKELKLEEFIIIDFKEKYGIGLSKRIV